MGGVWAQEAPSPATVSRGAGGGSPASRRLMGRILDAAGGHSGGGDVSFPAPSRAHARVGIHTHTHTHILQFFYQPNEWEMVYSNSGGLHKACLCGVNNGWGMQGFQGKISHSGCEDVCALKCKYAQGRFVVSPPALQALLGANLTSPTPHSSTETQAKATQVYTPIARGHPQQ